MHPDIKALTRSVIEAQVAKDAGKIHSMLQAVASRPATIHLVSTSTGASYACATPGFALRIARQWWTMHAQRIGASPDAIEEALQALDWRYVESGHSPIDKGYDLRRDPMWVKVKPLAVLVERDARPAP